VLCALEVVKINSLGVCIAKVSVLLEGFKVTALVDYLVVFWGLDVALGLRVNRYKLLVYLSLTLKLI